MRKAAEVRFVCQACGNASPKWLGRCPNCQGWNSLVEERAEPASRGARGASAQPVWLTSIAKSDSDRISTGMPELDRVLGGGLVPASFVLVGGDPGIGKSTLLLQAAANLTRAGATVLYVSAEESPAQVKLRAERLGVGGARMAILAETEVEAIQEAVGKIKPAAMVIDSIQTIWSRGMGTAPGSVGQVRECSGTLLRMAKSGGPALFVVCHVTKDGALAGPKVLEHLADCVLTFEGDRHHFYRILRSTKNRYGSTSEIGVFEMTGGGLLEVANPGSLFVSGSDKQAPGRAVAGCLEGTRPMMVEIQSLTGPSAYGIPQRRSQGVDSNRLAILLAVLEKRLGFHLSNQDVFLNVAGGLAIDEPAADMACALAIASSFRDKVLERAVFVGEVGLAGEIRPVVHLERRLEEAARAGYLKCVVPKANAERISAGPPGMRIEGVEELSEALGCSFSSN